MTLKTEADKGRERQRFRDKHPENVSQWNKKYYKGNEKEIRADRRQRYQDNIGEERRDARLRMRKLRS